MARALDFLASDDENFAGPSNAGSKHTPSSARGSSSRKRLTGDADVQDFINGDEDDDSSFISTLR